tara:strand:- start:211 stop:474 length:264 start_codon:yes stop_codon:yes gene_type:complete
MTVQECEKNIREYGSYGFEGWVECMDNYPELDDIIYDSTGDELPDTVITTTKNPFIPPITDNKKFKNYYIIAGIIVLILLGYYLIKK